MKKLLILALIIGFGFVYWRGTKVILTKSGMDCEWHAFYAICKQPKKASPFPSLLDVIKTGANFK